MANYRGGLGKSNCTVADQLAATARLNVDDYVLEVNKTLSRPTLKPEFLLPNVIMVRLVTVVITVRTGHCYFITS